MKFCIWETLSCAVFKWSRRMYCARIANYGAQLRAPKRILFLGLTDESSNLPYLKRTCGALYHYIVGLCKFLGRSSLLPPLYLLCHTNRQKMPHSDRISESYEQQHQNEMRRRHRLLKRSNICAVTASYRSVLNLRWPDGISCWQFWLLQQLGSPTMTLHTRERQYLGNRSLSHGLREHIPRLIFFWIIWLELHTMSPRPANRLRVGATENSQPHHDTDISQPRSIIRDPSYGTCQRTSKDF